MLESRAVPAVYLADSLTDNFDGNYGPGEQSLREAIARANSNPGADTVQLIAGTYLLDRTGPGEDASLTGDLDVIGVDLLTIQGISATQSLVKRNLSNDRVFDVRSGAALHLIGLTVADGLASFAGVSDGSTGAGVLNRGSVTVDDCIFQSNSAALQGGAIYTEGLGTTLTVNRTSFLNNQANGSPVTGHNGGAISGRSGTVTIRDSVFASNGAAGDGGVIYHVGGTVSIATSLFTDNGALARGGALYLSTGDFTIADSTFQNSQAGNAGGAIMYSGNTGKLTVTGSTFVTNRTSVPAAGAVLGGGAIYNGGTLSVINSTLHGNVVTGSPANAFGGAIYNAGIAQLIHATVTANQAPDGGGVVVQAGSSFTLVNSIIAQNFTNAAGNRLDVWGAFTSRGGNFIGFAGGGTGFLASDQLGTGSPIDPQLGPLQNNGGPTPTRASLTGSPLRDRGVSSGPGIILPTTDQRGQSRPSGAGFDIGAYEYQTSAPIARDDGPFNTYEDLPLNSPASVLQNDSDPDSPSVTAILVSNASHGNVILGADGRFVYSPFADYFGDDSFTYRAFDGVNYSTAATVSIRVNPLNDSPVARDDTVSTNEDTSLNVPVLANDSDVDGGPLTIISTTIPSHGTAEILANGTIRYTPSANYSGSDSFRYLISDGNGGGAIATVFMNVLPVNDPPVARDDSGTPNEDTPMILTVLSNDFDIDGDPLSVSAVTSPSHGSAVINANGTITYTPAVNYNGPDSFTYTVSDGKGGSATAAVSISVQPLNDPPTASDDNASTNEDTPITVSVLSNDSDIDGDTVILSGVSTPSHGAAVMNANGTITYTPAANYSGPDSFQYLINDGFSSTAIGTVFINILPLNDPPTARDDTAVTNEDTPVTVVVLANDSDVDGNVLTVTDVTTPAHGSAVVNADGTIRYTPALNYSGPDSFSYSVSDGNGGAVSATVSLSVLPVNDPPTARNDSVSTNEDTPVTVLVLSNDIDLEDDVLTVTAVTSPGNGLATLNADGTITYSPASNYNGGDSFTYTISDGNGGAATASVSIHVLSVNDPPTSRNDSVLTNEDTPATIAVLANDSDLDGNLLTVTSVSTPSHGTAIVNADGTIRYTPVLNYNGGDSFTYTISDGNGGTATASVAVTVNPVNDAPSVSPATFTIPENTINGTPVGQVVGGDVDGDSLTFSITSGNTGGAFSIHPTTGQITISNSGSLDFETTPVFSLAVQVMDPAGLSATAVVTVRLSDVAEIVAVGIDIRPGESTNLINTNSHGKIEVAILSSATFDARTVDLSSLRFGRTGNENSLSRKGNGEIRYRLEDVNGDGRKDVVVSFEIELMDFQFGDTVGKLTGRTMSGLAFAATDRVEIRRSGNGGR